MVMTTGPLIEHETLTVKEIDQRLAYLAENVTTYMIGGIPTIGILDARELIDELLALRFWHMTNRVP